MLLFWKIIRLKLLKYLTFLQTTDNLSLKAWWLKFIHLGLSTIEHRYRTSYLDLHLHFYDKFPSFKSYDTCHDFDLNIKNVPYLDGGIPRSTSCRGKGLRALRPFFARVWGQDMEVWIHDFIRPIFQVSHFRFNLNLAVHSVGKIGCWNRRLIQGICHFWSSFRHSIFELE